MKRLILSSFLTDQFVFRTTNNCNTSHTFLLICNLSLKFSSLTSPIDIRKEIIAPLIYCTVGKKESLIPKECFSEKRRSEISISIKQAMDIVPTIRQQFIAPVTQCAPRKVFRGRYRNSDRIMRELQMRRLYTGSGVIFLQQCASLSTRSRAGLLTIRSFLSLLSFALRLSEPVDRGKRAAQVLRRFFPQPVFNYYFK